MTTFPLVGIFIVLMAGVVMMWVVVTLGIILFASGRRGGQPGRVPAPGEMDPMTDPLHPMMMAGHGQAGTPEADRLIATGIAVDALAASQGSGHTHHDHPGAGLHGGGMHHDVLPPMHHDPGPTMPTTMPSHVDSPPSHHG